MTYQMHIKEWLREGRAEGIAIGEKRGIAIGERRGTMRGAHDARVETARGMLAYGIPQEKVAEISALPLAEVHAASLKTLFIKPKLCSYVFRDALMPYGYCLHTMRKPLAL